MHPGKRSSDEPRTGLATWLAPERQPPPERPERHLTRLQLDPVAPSLLLASASALRRLVSTLKNCAQRVGIHPASCRSGPGLPGSPPFQSHFSRISHLGSHTFQPNGWFKLNRRSLPLPIHRQAAPQCRKPQGEFKYIYIYIYIYMHLKNEQPTASQYSCTDKVWQNDPHPPGSGFGGTL